MSKLIERAKELEKEGNLDVALTYYEMALSDKESPFDVRKDFGRALNKIGDFKESNKCFNLVLTMDEYNIESLFGMGISLIGLNKWEEALPFFKKAIEFDSDNSNYYYYIAIILKELCNNNYQEFYERFLELNNEEYEKERLSYEFGLIFTQRDLELQNANKRLNIEGFKYILSSYDLNDDQISCYLRTYPLNKLKEKIIKLNDEKFQNDEKSILIEEYMKLGFKKQEIEDLLFLDSIENLKNKLISKTGKNLFHEKKDPLNIPIYIEYASEVEQVEISEDIPIFIASNYNIFDELKVDISLNYKNKQVKEANEYLKLNSSIKKSLELIKKYINENNYELSLKLINQYSLSRDYELSLKINLMFYKASIMATVKNDFKEALFYFDKIKELYPDITNNPIFRFNEGNLLYDNGNYYQAINAYIDSKIRGKQNDLIIFLTASAYYKVKDYKNALINYNQISSKNKKDSVVESIEKQFGT